jgi:hypothetical protein
MARGIQGVILRRFGARDHTATVVETVYIAPHFERVRMVSPTLFEDVKVEPAAGLRFWFPDPSGRIGLRAATRSRWPRRLKAGTGVTGMRGRHPKPRASSMSESGCVTSSSFPSPRYTPRPTGAPGARWAPAAVTSRTPPSLPRRCPMTGMRKALRHIAAGGRFDEFCRRRHGAAEWQILAD